MSRITLALAVCSFSLLCAPGQAQEASGPSDSARYTFHRVKDTFLRLDLRNGQVSDCGWAAIGWYCRVLPDERMALESEITRLQTSNTALKKELVARGLPLPDGIKPEPQIIGGGTVDLKVPGEADLDQAKGYVGKVWRRMVEMMASLQRSVLGRS